MRAVLGIDAAWTTRNPSGVALVQETGDGWRAVAVAPSYGAFLGLAAGEPVSWSQRRFSGAQPQPEELLAAAEHLLGGSGVSVVTVDMPLATVPITGRRVADQRVSKAFGAQHCAVHSPSRERPGPLATQLRDGFGRCGYPLATAVSPAGSQVPALLEVYPHPAIVNLLRLNLRLEYKVDRARRYWPAAPPAQRVSSLLANFAMLQSGLATRLCGIELPLPSASEVRSPTALKHVEDALDALVCAWVGISYLEGRAYAYGDETAAIWIPTEVDTKERSVEAASLAALDAASQKGYLEGAQNRKHAKA